MIFQKPARASSPTGLLDLITGLGGLFGKPRLNMAENLVATAPSAPNLGQNPNIMIFMPEERPKNDWQDWTANWGIERNPTIPDLPAYPAFNGPADPGQNLGDQIRRSWHDTHKDFAFTAVQNHFPDFTSPKPEPNQSYHQYIAAMMQPALAQGPSPFAAPLTLTGDTKETPLPELDAEWMRGNFDTDPGEQPPPPLIVNSKKLYPTPQAEADFDQIFEEIKYTEGGISDRENDPGKLTNSGITQKTYKNWLTKNKLKHNTDWPTDVTKLTPNQIRTFYREEIYYGNNLHEIQNPNIRHAIFDAFTQTSPQGVAQFSGEAIKKIMPDVNLGSPLNVMGPSYRDAINRIADNNLTNEYLEALADSRRQYQKNLKYMGKSLDLQNPGWESRVNRLRPSNPFNIFNF